MLAISRNEGMRSWDSSEMLRENVSTSRVQRSVSKRVIDIFKRRAQKAKKRKKEKKNSFKTKWKHERNLSGCCWLLHHNAVLQCQCTCKHHHSDKVTQIGSDQTNQSHIAEKKCAWPSAWAPASRRSLGKSCSQSCSASTFGGTWGSSPRREQKRAASIR
jgi:hypothetical protein